LFLNYICHLQDQPKQHPHAQCLRRDIEQQEYRALVRLPRERPV
jgi:hypothetical protein